MATNPAVSMPNAGRVREALEKCETVVVSDVLEDTDTERLAHIRLPALAWGEKDGTVTNSDRLVSRQRALFAPPGEARADWRIIADVARAMGFEAAFDYPTNASVFREYAAMTALSVKHGKKLDLTAWSGVSDASYNAMTPFRWGGDHPLANGAPTASRKPRIVAVEPPATKAASKTFPMRLNTGRYRDQWHTMTRTGYSPRLAHHRREPLVEIHSGDAKAWGVSDGDLCQVTTPYGASLYRATVTKGQARGALFVPMHWTDITASRDTGRTGRLASADTDPISGQPGFKDTSARIKRVDPAWRGFLVTREKVDASLCEYAVRSRVDGGWLYELAGLSAPTPSRYLPQGDISEVSYRAKGMHRYAVCDDEGALIAALFVTQTGDLPKREWVAAQIGNLIEDPAALLAGRPRVAAPDRGAIVCVCHDVGALDIEATIARGACSVAAIGAGCRAGTNCGSCRPELARMLQEWDTEIKEAAE